MKRPTVIDRIKQFKYACTGFTRFWNLYALHWEMDSAEREVGTI